MTTPSAKTPSSRPATVQFTNASARSAFVQDEIQKMAVRMGMDRITHYDTIYAAVIRENPELAQSAKRSALFTNSASPAATPSGPVLSLAEKAEFLNSEIDSIAAARGMDRVVKNASRAMLTKLALERRPDLSPKRSAHAACNIFSRPPAMIGTGA